MCVGMCICVCVCVGMCVGVYLCMCVGMYLCMCVCGCVGACVPSPLVHRPYTSHHQRVTLYPWGAHIGIVCNRSQWSKCLIQPNLSNQRYSAWLAFRMGMHIKGWLPSFLFIMFVFFFTGVSAVKCRRDVANAVLTATCSPSAQLSTLVCSIDGKSPHPCDDLAVLTPPAH